MPKCFVNQDGVIFTVTAALPERFKVIETEKLVQEVGEDGLIVDEFPLWNTLSSLALSIETEYAAGLAPWLDMSKLTQQRFEPYFYDNEPETGLFLRRQATLKDFPDFAADFFRGSSFSDSELQKTQITMEYIVSKGLFQWSVLINEGTFHEQHEHEVYQVGKEDYLEVIKLFGLDEPYLGKATPADAIEMKAALRQVLQYLDSIPTQHLPGAGAMRGMDRDWIDSLAYEKG